MKQITAYESDSGALFRSEEDCRKFEQRVAHEASRKAAFLERPWLLRNLFQVSSCVVGIVLAAAGIYNHFKHDAPPPGWGIACDGNGTYAPRSPKGYVADWKLSGSRQAAINRAWKLYGYEMEDAKKKPTEKPEPAIHWMDCTDKP